MSRYWRFACALLLPFAALAYFLTSRLDAAVDRGRDPWAFRLILENKTRMLCVALRSDLWFAFNPANGGIYKAWSGGVQLRGKVHDFSQASSYSLGTNYHTQRDTILRVADTTSFPSGWTSNNATADASGWTLTGQNSSITSPVLDLAGFDNPILTFFEQGAGTLQVQLSDDGGATWTTQFFNSTDTTRNGLQENQKLIVASGSNVLLRFIQPQNINNKKITHIALIGDYRVWSAFQGGSPVASTVDWRGYRIIQATDGIVLRYDIVIGASRVNIEERPEALPGKAITRNFTVTNLPANTTVSLKVNGTGLPETWVVTSGGGTLRTVGVDSFLDLSTNGSTTLNVTWL